MKKVKVMTMNNLSLIVLLSDKTKDFIKVILVIFLVVILLFALLGFIGNLIEKTMKHQAKKVDVYMTNVVISRVCDKPEDFVRIAKLKNKICFYRASIAPIIFGIIAVVIWVTYHLLTQNWGESIFDTKTGILSLFYVFDFSNITYVPPLGFAGIEISNYPHLLTDATMTNYFIFLFGAIAVIWYIINVQAYVARHHRIGQLKKTIYSKDLSTIDITHFYNLNKINPYANEIDAKKKVEEKPSTDIQEKL